MLPDFYYFNDRVMIKKYSLTISLFFALITVFSIKVQAQIPTVQYTPLAPYYYTHSTIYDTARVYSNGLIDQLCAIHYSIFKNDTLTPITSVGDYGSIEYTVRSYSTNYMTQSITNGTGYLSVKPLFTTYNAFTLGIFDNYCVSRNRPVMLEMVFDEPGYYKFYCEIQSCSNTGSSLGTSYTANGATGCGTASHSDYAATSCTSPTTLYGEALHLTICEQGSIAFSSGNTSYCPGENISIVYTLGAFDDLADTTGLPAWLTPTVDVLAQTLTLTGTAPAYDPANPSWTFPVSAKISVNPASCPGSFIMQTINILEAPTPVVTGNTSICEGSTIELQSNLKGIWTSSDGNIVSINQTAPDSAVVITGLSEGQVNIFCETTTGSCSVNSNPFQVVVQPLYKDTISATICSNEQYFVGSASYNTAGTITDTLVSVSGCDSIVTLNLTVLDTAFYEFWITDTSYTWNTITYSVSGNYTQTLASANGCDSVVTLHLTITTGIENNKNTIAVFPNPAQDVIHIDFTRLPESNMDVFIFDIYGRIVYNATLSKQQNTIDISGLASGEYFIEVRGTSNKYQFRFNKL